MESVYSVEEIEKCICSTLYDIGLPEHLKGYLYIKTGIEISGKDMNAVGSVTKLLYPEIAKRHGTTDKKVERAIRNAVEISWERGNAEALEDLFGYSRLDSRERPTNSEFIAGLADRVRMTCMEKSELQD